MQLQVTVRSCCIHSAWGSEFKCRQKYVNAGRLRVGSIGGFRSNRFNHYTVTTTSISGTGNGSRGATVGFELGGGGGGGGGPGAGAQTKRLLKGALEIEALIVVAAAAVWFVATAKTNQASGSSRQAAGAQKSEFDLQFSGFAVE